MKRIHAAIATLVTGLIVLGTTASYAQKKNATVWPAEDIKWAEMKGAPPGVMYANLSGDITKGAYAALIKLPAGLAHPLHTHSHDSKVVVISGTFLYAPEGGKEVRLGPGSYLMVPGGVRHTSGVSADGPCEIYLEGPGMFDFHPAKAMKK